MTPVDLIVKYADNLGLSDLSPLALYGTLSSIFLAAIVVGAIAQVWKERSGGLWAVLVLFVLAGSWLVARNTIDPANYTVLGGGESGWGILALGVSLGGGVLLVLVVALLPGRKSVTKRRENRRGEPLTPLSTEITGLSGDPITPVLPRPTRHSFRRKLFIPMVVLGIAGFIGAGVLSVEKKQLDIFLQHLGLSKAPLPPKTSADKPKAPRTGVKSKSTPGDPMIAHAQRLLLELEYAAGTPDGRIGGKTDEAIRKFQGWEGLPRNGLVTPDLIERLKAVTETQKIMAGKVPLSRDFQPHADMCKLGVRAWYRSRTTKLSLDGVTQEIEKLSANITVWFSYPGEDLTRARGRAVCKYSRYRGEMPDQPYAVSIKVGELEEDLNDREIGCFSEGQPC
ncbi:MAG: peptidoglycan-binding protein [Rhodospirillales bacterium]|nr:peptidoglycan-binding protein [Rhodospirillales bacterium]